MGSASPHLLGRPSLAPVGWSLRVRASSAGALVKASVEVGIRPDDDHCIYARAGGATRWDGQSLVLRVWSGSVGHLPDCGG